MRNIEARYEDGVLRPSERLPLRPGERVNLIVVRCPDPSRWNLERLASVPHRDELELTEQGLADWSESMDVEDSG
jgi:predicted DNA-binding antitoxin AbrB/MazE fold protein